MGNTYFEDPMLEAFVFETSQIVENLEQLVIESEKDEEFSEDCINEIFRYMHTIKGSSAMMMFNNISVLAHKVEDVFFLIRENQSVAYDFSLLIDVILESIDFFKLELIKIKNGEEADGNNEELIERVLLIMENIKNKNELSKETEEKNKVESEDKDEIEQQKYYIKADNSNINLGYYSAIIHYRKDSDMENIRSYTLVHSMTELVEEVYYHPNDIIDNDDSSDEIRKTGFKLIIKSKNKEEEIKEFLEKTIFLDKLDLKKVDESSYKKIAANYQNNEFQEEIKIPKTSKKYKEKESIKKDATISKGNNMISVNLDKLDSLLDLVGELVIAEAMVSQNPEVLNLEIESFDKASRQLHKISSELQDMVMAIRMVPLSTTFMKMHRIVRDMNRKLGKKVVLHVIGEETEVDKNIIEKISDPLMHIIRNALDHGIEDEATRIEKGKDREGSIELEAKNSGSDVLVIIRDDGKGLDKQALYDKAIKQGILNRKFEDMTDGELFKLILHPGFSTKEEVTEFSGRGVGMDVVAQNIESVGGSVIVDSSYGKGTVITLKIPLTLAIIEGMNIRVGDTRFTLPIIAIKESFRPTMDAIIKDTEGAEMIMVRGLCYPIVRLHEFYEVDTRIKSFDEGILIMVEDGDKSCCIFADELLGQQQVVVKSLPDYIKKFKNIKGLTGCTLLGDGSISLILDVRDFNLSKVTN